MKFTQILFIEMKKTKRSKILPLILIPPVLVVVSGVMSIRQYFTPEYGHPWQAMFVQSVLLFGYYLLPLSMMVVCAMLNGYETKDNGLSKMLSLPVSRLKLAVSKWVVLLFYLVAELAIFFIAFVVAGYVATQTAQITDGIPISYILKWSAYLFASFLPCMAVMWLITVAFEKPVFSIGLNMLFIIPSILVVNLPIWVMYPYCYSGYLVSYEMERLSEGATHLLVDVFPFLPCAILIFGVAVTVSMIQFGKRETR